MSGVASPGCAIASPGKPSSRAAPRPRDLARLPALRWPAATLERHTHHHHRFDAAPAVPGAEIEASRGCPYHCSFCAKENFRDRYRRRPLATILEELDGLIAAGVGYVYFIDEIFLPWRELLEAVAERPVAFGVQTRIDLWRADMLDLLGAAGCVSIEAGVESLTAEGRDWLDKDCRASTDELTRRLVHAKRSVPFVQANLIATASDDPAAVVRWRTALRAEGVWANEPVPLFPYPARPITGGCGACPTISPGSARSTTTSIAMPRSATSRRLGRGGSTNWRWRTGDRTASDRADDRRRGRRGLVLCPWACALRCRTSASCWRHWGRARGRRSAPPSPHLKM